MREESVLIGIVAGWLIVESDGDGGVIGFSRAESRRLLAGIGMLIGFVIESRRAGRDIAAAESLVIGARIATPMVAICA